MNPAELLVHDLGVQEYLSIWQRMQQFTQQRDAATFDQIWFVEHPAVYTQGISGKAEHVLDPHGIPVIQTNRGGQVTYHGPGQIVMYPLLDLRRKQINVRQLVRQLESAVIDLLAQYSIQAEARPDAPGVYVEGRKVAALGLRVTRGCSYHGLSLNVDMDLQPFQWINPCGYQGLQVTQLVDLGVVTGIKELKAQLQALFADNMGYTVQSN